MALYTNKVTLKGYLGKDAESFKTKQQKTVTVLSLATRSGYKKGDNWVGRTEWHRIVVFGKSAESAKALRKGDHVEAQGELCSSEFDCITDGVTVKRRNWEIHAGNVRKVTPPASSATTSTGGDPIPGENAA
ncbi:single-stranded DNA-binding protein [Edaphobacter acidisoli]|uniref:Single-stranded DNA-binding protein n=1 Tax=Edaphobacter acidisoli TaxID=2040573 RepID=A0A916S1J9_9BACT|nr:single-stranded DNA-binding protein [Edaphobacter acidisoli]GGA80237.1 single-stranded DNA-binding protein [Edaphobacter acidisoli]